MASRTRIFASSVGTKLLIALTGLALVGFLIVHLAGNLLIMAGPAAFNNYSHTLISNPFIIPAEIGLAALFLLHVYKTGKMFLDNRAARPVGYYDKKWAGHTSRKSLASTTMIYTGIVTFVFLVLHVKTFKFGAYYQAADTQVRDLHRLVLEVFSEPLYVLFYVVCMVLIGFHLRHGISSALQSLGIEHPLYTKRMLVIGTVLAIAIGGGFAFIPVWVYLMGGR